MSEIAPPLLDRLDEDEAGEFTLAHLDPEAVADPEHERDRYDEQILAALVSP